MTGTPRMAGTRRPTGTGALKRTHGGKWTAWLPRRDAREGGLAELVGTFDTRYQAERALRVALAKLSSAGAGELGGER